MNEDFSKNLRKLRLEKKLTQEQVAEKLGVSAQSVSRWETAASFPDILLLPEISRLYGVLVDDLLLGARDTMDANLRVKKYEAFLQHWVTEVPAIGLYQPNLTYFYNKNVRTFSNDVRLVTAIDRFSDVTDWAVNKVTKNKTP